MGYQCYEKDGRDQGYGVPAKCDHPDCDEDIDRGIGYACGGDPMENCGLFFCSKHSAEDVDPEAEWSTDNRHDFGVCERCARGEEPFDPKPDTEYWRAWKVNHPSWAGWVSENSKFADQNSHLVGYPDVMIEVKDEEIERLQSTNIELTRQIAILQARLETLKPMTDHVDAMEAQIRADFEEECG